MAWGVVATAIAIDNHWDVVRLTEEAEVRRGLGEERVRALTRRLVGVASHQMLEQEGLAGRLEDILTRQVDLEARLAALAAVAERAAPPDPVRTRRGELGVERPSEIAKLPVRDQFSRIESSLDRVEAGLGRTLASLTAAARAGVERVRTALADLHLAIAPPALPAVRPAARAAPPDAFAARLSEAQAAVTEAERWRGFVEGVPVRSPIEGDAGLSSNFGLRKDPFTGAQRMHAGMDFRSGMGTPVHTAAQGRVVAAGPSGGYGNLVEIDHGHGLVTRYGHLSAIQVSLDQIVTAGTVVGLVGSTGRSTGPHLHYETRLSGNALDPARFLAAGRTLFGKPAQETPAEPPPEAADAAD